jgi:tRNA-binding protein
MTITYDDFAKLEIRVAKIIATEKILGKTKIIKGTIDLGGETRNLIIGGAQYFAPEEMVGKTVIAITNLEPKTVGGVESNAMLLAADLDDMPYWLTVDETVPLGTKIK